MSNAGVADADYIVSGDDDLLNLGSFESDAESHTDPDIVKSSEFLDRVDREPHESELRR